MRDRYGCRVRLEEVTLYSQDMPRLRCALVQRGVPVLVTEALLELSWLRCDRLLAEAPGYAKSIRAAFAAVYKRHHRRKFFWPGPHKPLSSATYRRRLFRQRGVGASKAQPPGAR